MGDLFLNKEKLDDTTTVSNYFIDRYMPGANGEFVKIYIHLLRCASCQDADLSLEKLADIFTCTERDVTRALRYWEGLGLLTLTTDQDTSKIKGISLEDCKPEAEPISAPAPVAFPTPKAEVKEEPFTIPEYSIDKLNAFTSREDISQLIFIAEAYLGQTLSSKDTNTLLYFYDVLGFPADLIEYLIEYCVSNNKKRMRYIETVALRWAEEGICTVEQAKASTDAYNKKFYPVMKSMGITDHSPAPIEKEYIIRWTDDLGFSTDIIIEACNRTIQSIHKPDFRYANSILEKWKKKGIRTKSDIARLDAEHKNRVLSQSSAPSSPKIVNGFTDFEQRDYDYELLEKKLLANRR